MRENVVSVKNIYKTFHLPHENSSGIKQVLVNIFRKNKVKGYEIQNVLKGISFDVEKGDFFGIVGRNGSGKSTLLKLLAGIYTPDSGEISTSGSVVPFIELGVGFNPELTGRENIFMNGALLGFSHKEVEAMYDDIVGFAELDKFMDQKLKNYSSGMQVRLAFSIAIQAKGDILILDEVLAVGDESFQRKCDVYFDQIKKDKTKTVILVTHSMGSVKKYCNKAILIKDGEILASGNPSDVANQYTEENFSNSVEKHSKKGNNEIGLSTVVPHFKISPISKTIVTSSDIMEFNISYDYKGKSDIYLAFSMTDMGRGGIVYDSGFMGVSKGLRVIDFSMPLKFFNSSNFKIIATLRVDDEINSDEKRMIAFTSDDNSLLFSVRNKNEKSDYALIKKSVLRVEQKDKV